MLGLNNIFKNKIEVCRTLYFCVVCLLIITIGSIRSYPIYGKLDFLLIDNKPWWPEWKLLIQDTINSAEGKIIVTDPTTSTLLNSVFTQRTKYFRQFQPIRMLNIYALNLDNRTSCELLPFYSFPLLLNSADQSIRMKPKKNGPINIDQAIKSKFENFDSISFLDRPFSCLINLKGFEPTWVPRETKHWLPILAKTSVWYHGNGIRGKSLMRNLDINPPKNCTVYY